MFVRPIHVTSKLLPHGCLQVIVDVVEPGKLVLYPHILLACISLLGVSYVHLWELLLNLLSKVSHPACMLSLIHAAL